MSSKLSLLKVNKIRIEKKKIAKCQNIHFFTKNKYTIKIINELIYTTATKG